MYSIPAANMLYYEDRENRERGDTVLDSQLFIEHHPCVHSCLQVSPSVK